MVNDRILAYERQLHRLFSTAINGERILYTDPSFEQEGDRVSCVVFKIKSLLPEERLTGLMSGLDLHNTSGSRWEIPQSNIIPILPQQRPINAAMHHLQHYTKIFTQETTRQPFSKRIEWEWPSNPFEEWLEQTCDSHLMTMSYFKHDYSYDYASIIRVTVPVTDQNQFDYDYRNAILMTNLTYG